MWPAPQLSPHSLAAVLTPVQNQRQHEVLHFPPSSGLWPSALSNSNSFSEPPLHLQTEEVREDHHGPFQTGPPARRPVVSLPTYFASTAFNKLIVNFLLNVDLVPERQRYQNEGLVILLISV